MPRRIRKANISFISLVPKGANRINALYKDDGSIEIQTVYKAAPTFDEQGELLAVVYAPELRDSQGDIADASVVKQMAHDFIANGAKVDIRHDGKSVPSDKARVAESFIVEKSDTRFHGWKDRDGNPINLEGALATVIKIEDPELRRKYRSGEWAGVSMGGTAIVEQEKSLESILESILQKMSHTPTPENKDTMDTEKILKAITDGMTAGFASLATGLKEILKPVEKEEKKETKDELRAPIFKGSYSNPRAVQLYQRELLVFQMRKGTDWNDPQDIMNFHTAVTQLHKDWAEEDEAAGIETEPAPRKAGPAVSSNLQIVNGNFTKEERELIAAGRAIAEEHNNRRKTAVK